ncbi:MAG TPA: hypothetical protein VKY73_12625 [Polyangiaceae bacterium]|nr:hypothetical protein [Polyangiaceae bacterium]
MSFAGIVGFGHRTALLALAVTATACAGGPVRERPAEGPSRTPTPQEAPRKAGEKARLGAEQRTAPQLGPVTTLDAPVIVEGAAPDGSWVAVCEASRDTDGNGRLAISVGPRGELRGDRLERSLRLSNGRVLPIDDLLATSADGRWVVVRRANAVELFDTSEGALLALDDGVDARRTEPTRTAHRTLVFRDGALLYVRERGREHVVVERSLETGTERVVYSAREPVVRVTADAFGAVDVVELAGPDRNGNGRFDWAFPPSADPLPCGGPITTMAAARAKSDPTIHVVVPRDGGSPRRLDDLAVVFGTSLVRRSADGALFVDDGSTTRKLADAACKGRLVLTDPFHELFLLGCAIPKRPLRLGVELVTQTERRSLDIDVADLALDEPARRQERLVPLYPGADTVLFDTEQQALHWLERRDQVLGWRGAHALVRRGRNLFLFDADTAALRALPGKLERFADVTATGRMVHVSPVVVDLEKGRVLGSAPGPVLAVALSGAVLTATRAATAHELARGPLFWKLPR